MPVIFRGTEFAFHVRDNYGAGIEDDLRKSELDPIPRLVVAFDVRKNGELVSQDEELNRFDVPVADFWKVVHAMARNILERDSQVAIFLTFIEVLSDSTI